MSDPQYDRTKGKESEIEWLDVEDDVQRQKRMRMFFGVLRTGTCKKHHLPQVISLCSWTARQAPELKTHLETYTLTLASEKLS
jgi:hypothetical protein